jgi:hypothetical protein
MYGMMTPFFMHGFPYVHISAKLPQLAYRNSSEFLFPYFKSDLIEGDTSICCVFLRLVSDMVTLVKLRSSDHDQCCYFFAAAQWDRRASRRQGRQCGPVKHGFSARPISREGLIHGTQSKHLQHNHPFEKRILQWSRFGGFPLTED